MSKERSLSKRVRRVLDGENMRDSIFHMINDYLQNTVDMIVSSHEDYEDFDLNDLNRTILTTIPMQPITKEDVKGMSQKQLKHMLKERAVKAYEAKEARNPGSRSTFVKLNELFFLK